MKESQPEQIDGPTCPPPLAPRFSGCCRFRKWIFIALFLFAAVRFIQWWEGRGEGFRLYKIQEQVVYNPKWDLEISPKEKENAKKIVQQKFRYLGHGFQCYAFESDDGQYVIKFFRYQRLRLPKFLMSLPDFPFFSDWRENRILNLGKRRDDLLRACKTSWKHAKKETALLYMQLNAQKSPTFAPTTIIDLLGNEHTINLDEFQFMLQKKALHIKPTITSLMISGDILSAKKRISQIFQLLLHCAQHGIWDTDGALIRKNNLGFLGNRAIYIDGGKLHYLQKPRTKMSFEKDLARLYALQSWLKKEHPALETHFLETKIKTVQKYADFLAKNGLEEKRS
ncbi:MAG: hypothetical protein QRY74_06340 [Chlamydia sp.]